MQTLKILDYAWHVVHAYRLHALPAEFTFLQFKPLVWNEAQRPIPPNWMGAVYPDEIDPRDYDLALLHLDQWCDERKNLRALPYRLMNLITEGIPQVVIMHGTPDHESNRLAILDLIGDHPVVCNSVQAARMWDGGEEREDRYGLPQFRSITHGYHVEEFYNLPLEARREEIITICSGRDLSREYHGIPLLERLWRDVPLAWYGPAGNRSWLTNYHDYRMMLATSLIYFSPTRRAPMPGARTEALLSGCCVVSVPGNDWEDYIDHGETGYIVNTYVEARDLLLWLLEHPEEAYRVGQAGREMGHEMFNTEPFVTDWLTVIEELQERA